VPVFNVSMSLMREVFPHQPFRLIDVGAAVTTSERRSGADRRTAEVHS
jgi:hypothetical protein